MADFTFGPVGAIHRPHIRRAAIRFGVSLTEDKALIQSGFHVTGPLDGLRRFHTFVADYVARNDALDRADEAREAARRARQRWWNPLTWTGLGGDLAKYLGLYLAVVLGIPFGIVGIAWLCGASV